MGKRHHSRKRSSKVKAAKDDTSASNDPAYYRKVLSPSELRSAFREPCCADDCLKQLFNMPACCSIHACDPKSAICGSQFCFTTEDVITARAAANGSDRSISTFEAVVSDIRNSWLQFRKNTAELRREFTNS